MRLNIEILDVLHTCSLHDYYCQNLPTRHYCCAAQTSCSLLDKCAPKRGTSATGYYNVYDHQQQDCNRSHLRVWLPCDNFTQQQQQQRQQQQVGQGLLNYQPSG
jgi:hypothetical protein